MTMRPMDIQDYDSVYNLWINTPGMRLNITDDSREGIEKYGFVSMKDEMELG